MTSIFTSKVIVVIAPGPVVAVAALTPSFWSDIARAKPRPERDPERTG